MEIKQELKTDWGWRFKENIDWLQTVLIKQFDDMWRCSEKDVAWMAMNLHDRITSKQTYIAKSLTQIIDSSKKLIELI